jgi:hypothetical protein
MTGMITVAIAVTFIVVAIASADWFLSKLLGIPVGTIPFFIITFIRLIFLGGVIYLAYKFFGSRG